MYPQLDDEDGTKSEDSSPADPFEAEENEFSMDEGESPPAPVEKRSVPSKAKIALNVEADNPWRTSTVIGNLPVSDDRDDKGVLGSTSIPIKAQKTLGISTGSNENEENKLPLLRSAISSQPVPAKAQKTLGIPTNPFQKSVASAESQTTIADDVERQETLLGSSIASIRVPLDVNAFTRLLMTGEKDPTTLGTHSGNILLQGQHGDSSSNTDASSLSRHSIFESQTESHLETPRTSHEIDDDQRPWTGITSLKPEGRGPPVPQSRHGKSIKGASGHTVTFAEPDVYTAEQSALSPTSPTRTESYIADKPPTATPSSSHQQLTEPSPLSPTDLNKPLPPPPSLVSQITDVEAAFNFSDSSSSRDPFTHPRHAPTPPVRRQSQRRSGLTSNTSRRPSSIAEESVPESPLHFPLPPNSSSKPPAPPPPRRRDTERSSVVLDSPAIIKPPTALPASPKLQPAKQPPPLPPSRSSSFSKRTIRPTPRPSTSSGSIPPPPPPPRRRGSSGSASVSIASIRRPSSEIFGQGNGPVMHKAVLLAQQQSSADAVSKVGARNDDDDGDDDIMANLSRLQREVDDLRGQVGEYGI